MSPFREHFLNTAARNWTGDTNPNLRKFRSSGSSHALRKPARSNNPERAWSASSAVSPACRKPFHAHRWNVAIGIDQSTTLGETTACFTFPFWHYSCHECNRGAKLRRFVRRPDHRTDFQPLRVNITWDCGHQPRTVHPPTAVCLMEST